MPCQGPWGGGYGGDSYRHDYLEAERRLCEARWLLLQVTSGTKLTPKLRALLAKHKSEQLKHRKGDKTHVIERIDSTLARVRDDQARVVRHGGNITDKSKRQVARLLQERKRIAAISNTQLLADYWGSEKRLTSDLVDHE